MSDDGFQRIEGSAMSRVLIAIALLLPTAASAQSTNGHAGGTECQATIAGNEVERLAGYCYERFVVNAAPDAEALPVVIALHWSTSTPAEFQAHVRGLQQPARVVMPQGPYPKKAGFSFYPASPNYYELPADEKMPHLLQEADRLSAFITAVSKKYPSPVKPVLLGASQGGDLSYAIAIRNPDRISLAIPLLATIDERLIGKAPAGAVPVRAFHGADDRIVPLADAGRHVAALASAGHDARLRAYPGTGHDIPVDMQRDYLRTIDRHLSTQTSSVERKP